MTTITLPADLERRLAELAQLRGTTTEQVALEGLRRVLSDVATTGRSLASGSLYDLLAPHIGVLDGPAADFSKDCGRRFEEGLADDWKRSQP